MSDFENKDERDGLACKLWRGERMTMIGFDVTEPEDDLVGFSIEVKSPNSNEFFALRNRIAFAYDTTAVTAVDGDRKFDSRKAPFQKFRWVHFPYQPVDGRYVYRVTKQHMPHDGEPIAGTSLDVDIDHRATTIAGLVDIGFTRNFASSQAYKEQFGNNPGIIPGEGHNGLNFQKLNLKNQAGQSVYEWLGFEAYDHIFGFLNETFADPGLTLDAMAYDLNEPDVVARLERFGNRLRVIVDDSVTSKDGVKEGHGVKNSPESISAKRFGAANAQVKRTHFQNLQHNKIFITRRSGVPEKVLCGSTNFTFRGIYIQANNVLVFHSADVAGLFGKMFDLAFTNPADFKKNDFAKTWHAISTPGKPVVKVCFSPHVNSDLSLNPIRGAVDQATSSVLYSVAFLGQMTSGPSKEAFDRLIQRPVFSYGTVDQRLSLELLKPDGTRGLVDFKYLASKAPQPFAGEWSGGKGRNVHHKFVVTDFSLPTAKVFSGSSNFSPSGESKNGDHLIVMEDRKVATAYAIEAVRVFDHLHFRNRMNETFNKKKGKNPEPITLRKPTAISGKPTWFGKYYGSEGQAFRDRKLFST